MYIPVCIIWIETNLSESSGFNFKLMNLKSTFYYTWFESMQTKRLSLRDQKKIFTIYYVFVNAQVVFAHVFWHGHHEWEAKKNDVCLFHLFPCKKKIINKIHVCSAAKGLSGLLWVCFKIPYA